MGNNPWTWLDPFGLAPYNQTDADIDRFTKDELTRAAITRRKAEVIDRPLGQAAQGFVQATGGRYVKAVDDKATRDTIVKWSDRVGLACDIATVPGKKYAATKALGAVLHPVQTARKIGSGLSTAHAACSSAYRWVGRRLAGNGDDLAKAAARSTENAVEAGARSADNVAEAAAKSGDNLAAKAERPSVKTSLPDRVTRELPPGQMRTPEEVEQARNFFERNRSDAQRWWSERNSGRPWPENATHAEHPRAIKDGGDPLFIEPGFGGPNAPHMVPGPDGLTDFQRWGLLGGRPRKN